MKEQSITVALRVRPINAREIRCGAKPIAKVADQNLVILADPGPNRDSDEYLRSKRSHEHQYMFDVALKQPATQQEVYEQTAQGLIAKVISGYNATVFAYGATGAGKTYTMLGRPGEPGIMALTLNDLFSTMEQNKATSQYRVTMAYLEIYNEMVRNLLGPSSGEVLDLREDAHGATIVSGLMEIEVKDTEEVMALLTRGNLRRTCEPTAVNRTSSRSHAVLKVTVEQKSRVMNIVQKIRTGVLFMVDLAGSERAANTKNRGQRMKEGAHINRSLLALANCINTLCSGGQYVNYRDSKLTRLLKDALSGNCFTVMIAHISPASTSYEESKNTLKYADRVKHLKTKVTSNVVEVDQHVADYQMCMESMQSRIKELERQLERRDGEGESLCSELRALLAREKDIRQEMVSLEHQLLLIAIERQKHTAIIRQSEGLSTPSPLPPSSLSPLPTTLEDMGQTSLLFERSSNWFAEPSHMIEPTQGTEEAGDDDHMTAMETTDDNHDSSHDDHVTSDQLTSLYSDLPVPTEESERGEEGEEVSVARVELVGLQMKRRRVEARHRRLGRKLMEIRTAKSQLQKRVFMCGSGLHPHQVELCLALQLCSDLEEEARKRELVGARLSLQMRRSDSALDRLLDVNHQLVAALVQCRSLLEERVDPQSQCSLLPPLQPLLSHNTSLVRQVERERRLPVAGRALQLPSFSAFSSRLCATASTTFAGSKSNLLVEDVTDGEGEEEEEGEGKMSTVASLVDMSLPVLPSYFPQDSSLSLLQQFSSISLPPIPHTTSLITSHTTTTTHGRTVFPNSSTPAVLHHTSARPLNNGFFSMRYYHSKQSPPSLPAQSSTTVTVDPSTAVNPTTVNSTAVVPSTVDSTAVDPTTVVDSTAVPTPKRTSAKAILSKVAPQIGSSSSKRKYVFSSEAIEEDSDTAAAVRQGGNNIGSVHTASTQSALHASTNTEQGTSGAAATEVEQQSLVKSSSGDTETATAPGVSTVGGGGGERERKDLSLQSASQLSLSRSTPQPPQLRGRRSGPGARVGRRFRPRQSSIPLVRITEQKTRREAGLAASSSNNRPRNSMPTLSKRRPRERETLVPAKAVVAGDKMVSPYLNTTAMCKSEMKRAAPKKAVSSHPVTKFKSPYHVNMAKTNRTRK